MSLYRILSLDGGGIRGVLTASLLERLEQEHPGFMSMIDLFAGTSTGGILALGLAFGLTPKEARELYERCGTKVFSVSLVHQVEDLGQLLGAKFSHEALQEELDKQFGTKTLGDLPKKVLISSFDLDNNPSDPSKIRTWKPKFFHNYPGPGSDENERIVDVALRTSAAPTFFPIYQGYTDGGVVANNPSLCALAQALHPDMGKQKMRDLRLLSVGTGSNPKYLTVENADWGLAKWAPNLISLMLDGSVGLADYQCTQILGKNYFRLNPFLPMDIGLDRVDQIPLMKQIVAGENLMEIVLWLKRNFKPTA